MDEERDGSKERIHRDNDWAGLEKRSLLVGGGCCCVSLHLNGMSEARLICHGKMKSLGCCEDFYKKDKRQSGRLRSEIVSCKGAARVTPLRARE